MEFIPSGRVYLCANVPLDKAYNHTIYFENEREQNNYFLNPNRLRFTFENISYTRVYKNTLMLKVNAENVYYCNYLCFQNKAGSGVLNKWYYAFITNIEYKNPETTEITYELDVMQTWFFEYSLKQCFVEREHAASDKIGENLIPENLDIGEYISNDFLIAEGLTNFYIAVAATFDKNYNDAAGAMYSGVYQGLKYLFFPNTADGATAAANFILGAGAKADGIVSVSLVPAAFAEEGAAKSYDISVPKNYYLRRSDNKAIKNNKLYTYPYSFLYISNQSGTACEYRYEYFNHPDGKCHFLFLGDISGTPTMAIVPNSYKGVANNWDECMTLSNYPQLAYATDSYKAWLAQAAGNAPVTALTSAFAGVASGAASGNIATMASGLLGGLAQGATALATPALSAMVHDKLAQTNPTLVQPLQAHAPTSSNLLAAYGVLRFYTAVKHITPQYCTIIDDYFNAFGYATNRIKVPNRYVRKGWTYTKTNGCALQGTAPSSDLERIAQIYDHGVTFWQPNYRFGDYSQDNSVKE